MVYLFHKFACVLGFYPKTLKDKLKMADKINIFVINVLQLKIKLQICHIKQLRKHKFIICTVIFRHMLCNNINIINIDYNNKNTVSLHLHLRK